MSNKNIKDESSIIGTPVTSEDLLEIGVEFYGDEVGAKQEREAESKAEVEVETEVEAEVEVEAETETSEETPIPEEVTNMTDKELKKLLKNGDVEIPNGSKRPELIKIVLDNFDFNVESDEEVEEEEEKEEDKEEDKEEKA